MEEFIVTRCVKNKKQALEKFEAVTYEAPKKKQKSETFIKNIKDLKSENSEEEKPPMDPRKKQELEMKRARFEVMKFGMTGFKKNKAREAKIALAISLGARPLRNKKRNYKEILNERKLQKAKEERQKTAVSGVTQSLKKPKRRRKFKKESGILGVYGKVQRDSK
ncbi:uncharacterized protein C1orf131 [Belonocnema kinseyi]|uniref:uncharacterized protein C1orf131 n=1 Tax=Belonocnema kinseyi TaxID=2817044 RepID=UPI00143D5EB9|nr:uncharacterized protein C1orf131 [Belonocnema kinseyi]